MNPSYDGNVGIYQGFPLLSKARRIAEKRRKRKKNGRGQKMTPSAENLEACVLYVVCYPKRYAIVYPSLATGPVPKLNLWGRPS